MKMVGVVSIVLVLFATKALAEYGTGTIKRFYVESNGQVHFGLTTELPGTCSFFGEHFIFDATTPGGKSELATIIAAKMANAPVAVWYSRSDTPGTDQTNGCTNDTMAVLTGVGVQ